MKTTEEKKFLNEFNNQWKTLWHDLVGDKVHAEKIACKDFPLLFIEQGTVVKASREIRQLSYSETLKQQRQKNGLKTPSPDPKVGGWGKFSRTMIKAQKKSETEKENQPKLKAKPAQQPKKGWLHIRP